MIKITDEQSNILANVIRIAGTVTTIAIDAIDGYATPEQTKREILKCVGEIKNRMEVLI